jgi:hypothetical protein
MSHIRLKTKYTVMGAWGSRDEKTLFCHFNNTVDIATFYDETGKEILFFEDTESNTIWDAMNRLVHADGFNLPEGVEHMTHEEFEMCKKPNKSIDQMICECFGYPDAKRIDALVQLSTDTLKKLMNDYAQQFINSL